MINQSQGQIRFNRQIGLSWIDDDRRQVRQVARRCLGFQIVNQSKFSLDMESPASRCNANSSLNPVPSGYIDFDVSFGDAGLFIGNPFTDGATSANLPRLGHTRSRRPIFPLDQGVTFTPQVQIFQRG